MDLGRFFATKLYGIRKALNHLGDVLPERSAIQFKGMSTYDDSELGATIVELGQIDSAQHGNLGGGTLHANASSLASGFMSAADKTRLDAATSVNTPSTIVSRDAGGNVSVSELKTEAVESQGSILVLAANGATVAQVIEDPVELRTNGIASAETFSTLTSTVHARMVGSCPSADPAHWKEVGNSKWTNLLAATGSKLIIRVTVPNGAILTSFSVRIDPPAHGVAPAARPSIALYRFSEFSALGTLVATATDPGSGYSLPDTVYDAAHTISCTVGFGGEVIDNTNSRYYIELTPESGLNALAGTEFLWARVTYTLPAGTNIGAQ